MESTDFQQSIIKTLAYFDIFDYPLTREELFRFLWQPSILLKYADFIFALDHALQTELKGKIENQGGYYFFSGRNEIIAKRERKVLYTEEKIEIAKVACQKIRYLPFVQALFVCNQLPIGVKKSSDIDVFIVIRPGRIWFSRALITLVLSIFRLRRTKERIADQVCLSFYVTSDNLDLSSICIPEPDIYQVYWTNQLIPVYDPTQTMTRIEKTNTWMQKYIPHSIHFTEIGTPWRVQDFWFSKFIKKSLEWIFGGFIGYVCEKQIRLLQLQKMKLGEKIVRPAQDKSVVISDTMLKFHENDRKKYFKEEWEKRWQKYI